MLEPIAPMKRKAAVATADSVEAPTAVPTSAAATGAAATPAPATAAPATVASSSPPEGSKATARSRPKSGAPKESLASAHDQAALVADPGRGDVAATAASGDALEKPDAGSSSQHVDPDKLTPMMRQYLETKAQVPGAILFFRLGDFYEMFFEDAVQAAELLSITLTSRAKGLDRVPMCGVPYHAARRYIARLIAAGKKVAICEQVEAKGGPAIVKREVVRVVTPGMVLDDQVLEPHENNFLLSLCAPKSGVAGDGDWGGALLDASTGELLAIEPGPLSAVLATASGFVVREVLVAEEHVGEPSLESALRGFAVRPAVATLEADAFSERRAEPMLLQHFGVKSLDGFGLKGAGPSLPAVAAALRYLKSTQRSDGAHVDRVSMLKARGHLIIDEASSANLELLRSIHQGQRQGSLVSVIDQTCTAAGSRKLSRWVAAPLCDVETINARLDAVDELHTQATWRERLTKALKQVADIERLCGRLSLQSGTPRDLRSLGVSLTALPLLAAELKAAKSALLRALVSPLLSDDVATLAATLSRAIIDEPPAVVADGGFIAPGYHAELDELSALSATGKDFLLKLEQREKERTGIASLKVRYNRVFGYYLEVTKSNLGLVPKEWVRKQTTVGGERYVTDELKSYEEKVLTADEKRIGLEQRLFDELKALVVARSRSLKAAADAAAVLDVCLSFASVSAQGGWCRPVVDDSTVLELEAARHPVVEKALVGERFVPNDVMLDRESRQLIVITGPNMAGKSTVMRQTALAVVLAQAGCFVPARRARVGVCDRVFTRVGASDNLARGHSTFMVEMTETANILHHATKRSLVVLDEIGRGTSTFDGLSIAWAVAEHLHDRIGARTLFATHYHELTDLARERPKVKNYSIAVKEHRGQVTFLRTLVEGAASRSYGIEVAKLAGLPPEVLARARELLKNLEASELDETGHARLAHTLAAVPPRTTPARDDSQLGLFAAEPQGLPTVHEPSADDAHRAVLAALAELAIDRTTPLEALTAIARWQQQLRAR